MSNTPEVNNTATINESLARRCGWEKTIQSCYLQDVDETIEQIVWRNGDQVRTWNYPPNYLESRDAFWRDVIPAIKEQGLTDAFSDNVYAKVMPEYFNVYEILSIPLETLCKAALECLPLEVKDANKD